MPNTFKAERKYINQYEALYNRLSPSPFFNQQSWEKAAREGNLDIYADSLERGKNINYNKFLSDWNLEYADEDTKLNALYTELYSDKTKVSKHKFYDENGREYEKETTDYDYYKSMIQDRGLAFEQQHFDDVVRERKENMNGFLKYFANIAGTQTSLWRGLFNSLNDWSNIIDATIRASVKGIGGENFGKVWMESIADDEGELFKGITDALTAFESKYTDWRDINGEYSDWGKYVGGALTSIGEYVPGMLAGAGFGKLAAKAGLSVGVSQAVNIATSKTVFYGGMTGRNISEISKQFAANDVSVESSKIIANALVKSAQQIAVEEVLDKILGPSGIDAMFFGKSIKASTGKNLASTGLKRLFKNAGKEGFEEVLQDTGDFLVDKAFAKLVDDDFGNFADLTLQGLIDSFVIGGLSSLVGDSIGIIRSGGTINGKNVNPIAAWEYGLDYQSMLNNMRDVFNMDKHRLEKDFNRKKYIAAYTQAYGAFRMISSVYGAIGEKRATAANNILTKITRDIKNGIYNVNDIRDMNKALLDRFEKITESKEQGEKLADKAKKSSITKVKKVETKETIAVKKKSAKDKKTEKTPVEKAIDKILEPNSGIDKLVTTADGKETIAEGNTVVTPENKLEAEGALGVFKSLAEKKLVESIAAAKYPGDPVATITELYRKERANENATTEEAITALLYDEEFSGFVVKNADKDIFNFITKLQDIERTVVKKGKGTLRDAVYVDTINKVMARLRNQLADYCIYTPTADFTRVIYLFSDVDERKAFEERIKQSQAFYRLEEHFLAGELTAEEKELVTNMLNYSKVPSYKKTDYNLIMKTGGTMNTRYEMWQAISEDSRSRYLHNYDGKTYLTADSLPNNIFNRFIQNLGLTLKTWLQKDSLTDADRNAMTNKGFNDILSYRKYQFETYTRTYSFDYKKGKLQIFDDANNQVGGNDYYSDFIQNKSKLRTTDDHSEVTNIGDNSRIIKSFVNSGLSDAVSGSLTINDILLNVDYLSRPVKNAIIKKYGFLNTNSAFAYIKEAISEKGLTIVVNKQGDFSLANFTPMDSLYKQDIDIRKKLSNIPAEGMPISEIMDVSKLPGFCKNIILVNDPQPDVVRYGAYVSKVRNISGYDVASNKIYINSRLLKLSNKSLKYTVSHEVQHAIQSWFSLNGGGNAAYLKSISDNVMKEIITELKKYRPFMFEGTKNFLDEKRQAIRFLYEMSSESAAYGNEGSAILDFYPVMIDDDKIKLPFTNKVFTDTKIIPTASVFADLRDNAMDMIADEEFNDLNNAIDNANTPVSDPDHYLNSVPFLDYNETDLLSEKDATKLFAYYVNKDNNLEKVLKLKELSQDIIRNNPNVQSLSQSKLYQDLNMQNAGIMFNDFLDYDIPYIRIDEAPGIDVIGKDKSFAKCYLAIDRSVDSVLGMMYGGNIDITKSQNVYQGSVKVRDILFYNSNGFREIAVPYSNVINDKSIIATPSKGQSIIDMNFNNITDYETAQIEEDIDYFEYDDDATPIENAVTSKTVRAKKRQVSNKAMKGTNLEYFAPKDDRRFQMDPRLQEFIVNAAGKNKVANVLQKKIDGSEKGTLTIQDVYNYLRYTPEDKIDEKTFDAINEAFFKNPFITSFEELEYKIEVEGPLNFALYKVLEELDRKIIDGLTTPDAIKFALEQVQSKPAYQRKFDEQYEYYSKPGKSKADLKIDEHNLRILFMRYYDGSLRASKHLVSIARNGAIAKKIKNKNQSFDKRIGKDDKGSLYDVIPDKDTTDAYNYFLSVTGLDEKIDQLVTTILKEKAFEILAVGGDIFEAAKFAEKYRNEIESKPEYEVIREWERVVNKKELDEIDALMIKSVMTEASGTNMMTDPEVDKGVKKIIRSKRNVVANIKNIAKTISRYLIKPSEKKRFLEENKDIFNNDFTIKDEVINFVNEKGLKRNRDISELAPLEERLRKLSKDVRAGYYKSKYAYNLKKEREKLIQKNQAAMRAYQKLKAKKDVNAKDIKTYEIRGESIIVESNRPLPVKLKEILDTELSKGAETHVKNLSAEGELHVKMSLDTFIKDHAELLATLTQADIDEIIDYYLNTALIENTNRAVLYTTVKQLMITYIIIQTQSGRYTISKETMDNLKSQLKTIQSLSGTAMVIHRDVWRKLNPEETIVSEFAEIAGLDIENDPVLKRDIDNLVEKSKDISTEKGMKAFIKARDKFYKDATRKYDGDPTIFDKLLTFEQMALLSGPGTWARNWFSNKMIQATTPGFDAVGTKIGDHLKGLFKPKTKNKVVIKFLNSKKYKDIVNKFKNSVIDIDRVENIFIKKAEKVKTLSEALKIYESIVKNYVQQYRFIGTKVSDDTKKFIDDNFINNGLMDMIDDGLGRYDTRKVTSTGTSTGDMILDMIVDSIKNELFMANKFKTEKLNDAHTFILRMLSDSKFVKRDCLNYFGKMLTESGISLSNGLTPQIMKMFAEAYRLASYKYIHRPNIINDIERKISVYFDTKFGAKKGSVMYLMYKQIFPFASAGFNWFIEGLKFNPASLAISIYKLAHLESEIDKLENLRQSGKKVVSSQFAEYLIKQDIGKGVIGSITMLIGALLCGFGIAGLDEEDDKLKLRVGNFYLDVSELYASQGVMLGISIVQAIKDGETFEKVIGSTFDTLFTDFAFSDMFNSFRYSETFGDWLAYQPWAIGNMFTPNFLKTLVDVSSVYDVTFTQGFVGRIERYLESCIPGFHYALPAAIDPYTGEKQYAYKMNNGFAAAFTKAFNKGSPIKIYNYDVSYAEKEAIRLGLNKSELTGQYTVGDKKITIRKDVMERANVLYGKLNKKDLEAFRSNKVSYKVQDENGKFVTLRYSRMTDEQKKTVMNRIMTHNREIVKIKVLTERGYKYYATDDMYKDLKRNGITSNVYKSTAKKSGFI